MPHPGVRRKTRVKRSGGRSLERIERSLIQNAFGVDQMRPAPVRGSMVASTTRPMMPLPADGITGSKSPPAVPTE